MRGNPFCIPGDGEFYAFQEVLLGDGRDGDVAGGDGEAVGVVFWTEEQDIAVWVTVGFQAFVGLLAVVESRGEAVDLEVGVFDEGGLAPFSSGDGVGGLDVAVNLGRMLEYRGFGYGVRQTYHCPEC